MANSDSGWVIFPQNYIALAILPDCQIILAITILSQIQRHIYSPNTKLRLLQARKTDILLPLKASCQSTLNNNLRLFFRWRFVLNECVVQVFLILSMHSDAHIETDMHTQTRDRGL